jgi:hypothetical protein
MGWYQSRPEMGMDQAVQFLPLLVFPLAALQQKMVVGQKHHIRSRRKFLRKRGRHPTALHHYTIVTVIVAIFSTALGEGGKIWEGSKPCPPKLVLLLLIQMLTCCFVCSGVGCVSFCANTYYFWNGLSFKHNGVVFRPCCVELFFSELARKWKQFWTQVPHHFPLCCRCDGIYNRFWLGKQSIS